MSEWIKHDGKGMPVDGDTLVDVLHADSTPTLRIFAREAINDDDRYGFDWWSHRDTMKGHEYGYITHYRIIDNKED